MKKQDELRDFVNDGREVENYLILPSGDLRTNNSHEKKELQNG